jgi:CubicO group peptidase (beta-lactamase class C family)
MIRLGRTAVTLALTAWALGAPATAQVTAIPPAAIPDTAAGHRFADWLAVFNRGDEAALKAYMQENLPADPGAVELFKAVRDTTGPLVPFKVTASGDLAISVVMAERDTDAFDSITLLVDRAEPHRIAALTPRRLSRAEAGAPPIAPLPEPQLLAATRARLEAETRASLFSGVLLLAKDGKPILQFAGGPEDRERGIANSLQTRFGLASISKIFVTVGVVQLAQAGKIDLDAPIARYLPDYPNRALAQKVTVNELLTHTGGTGDIFGTLFDQHSAELRRPSDYIALFGPRPAAFEPGARRGYSNFGFVVLGAIIEAVSHQRYEDYLADHVFAPAHMTGAGYLPASAPVAHRAVGYMMFDGALVVAETLHPGDPSPAGGAYATAGDLLKFEDALIGGRLLDKAHTALLLSGKADIGGHSYAYDVGDKAENGAPFIGHQGGGRGANGDVRAFLANGYTLVILSNYGPPYQKFAQFVSDRLPSEP